MNRGKSAIADWAIIFDDAGRTAQNPSDPRFPAGVDIDTTRDLKPSCWGLLPYPAPRIGHWDITCRRCGLRVAITAAGRADDPRSLRIPCG